MYDFLEGIIIDGFDVLAINKRFRVFILKNNKEKGEAIKVKINETIYEIPPTSPKTSNSPYVFL